MDASTINTSTFTLKQGTTPVAGTVSYSGVTATFTPAATLSPLTTYTATISTGTKELAGNALSTDMSWSFTTGVIPDTTAPTASATVPAFFSNDTATTEIYTLSLHDALPISTINTSTFTLKQGTTPVAGTVSYSGVTATFTPAATLSPLTTYTATISTGTKELAGNALSTDMSWSFTTGVIPDTTAPTASATVPAFFSNDTATTEIYTLSLHDALPISTINTSTFTLKQGTTPVAGTVSYSGVTATFTPAATLAPLTTYKIGRTTCRERLDISALAVSLKRNFTTGVTPDTTAPILSAIGPANADTNVPLNETITVAFSEPMDPSTINTTTFTLTQGTTPVAGTVTYTNGTAIFTPADTLAPLTTY